MFNNVLTIVISHYNNCIFTEALPSLIHRGSWLLSSLLRLHFLFCIFTEALPSLIHHGSWLLSSLPRLQFLSLRGEFAAITFGKDEVLPCANGPIVSSGTVNLSTVIGSFLVGILPYGPFPWKQSWATYFFLFSQAGKFKNKHGPSAI